MVRLLITSFQYLAVSVGLLLGSTPLSDLMAKEMVPHIELALSFDVKSSLLQATMKVDIPEGQALKLELGDLSITAALLSTGSQENQVITLQDQTLLELPVSPLKQQLLLSYEKQVGDTFRDTISADAIVLTSLWHPMPDRKATFSLQAQVPPGFTAICESDHFNITARDGAASFSFSQPIYGLTFAAAPYIKKSRQVREGLKVYTLFFEEEQDLADGYLDSAVSYIKRYEEQIGTFPYNHYLIVENVKPTGFGLPTFTLLGRQVIRLPFIRNTSLGHEILHSWFGNSITPSINSGNWSEGLTTYFADMAYREDLQEGSTVRKEKIQEYLSYVKPQTPPLSDFVAASHNSPANRAIRAVGYGRSAMLFHELQIRLGKELFHETIRIFFKRYRGKSASWDDIKLLFEEQSETDLERFFRERLTRVELPDIAVSSITVKQHATATTLSFSLDQNTEVPFELMVPFTIITMAGEQHEMHLISENQTHISITTDSQPLELIVDGGYDVMRRFSLEEQSPVWSQILGADKVLVLLDEDQDRDNYQAFLDQAPSSWHIATAAETSISDIAEQSVILIGPENHFTKSLFGSQILSTNGFTLDMRQHPFSEQQVIALVSSTGASESDAAAHRLSHYGKYSYLRFNNGRIVEKTITPADQGIIKTIQEQPSGFEVSALSDFDQLVKQLSTYQVIYVGEMHTSRADHLLQYMLIEALFQQKPNLVIGMEMFPGSSQQALDRYITGEETSEAAFLTDSRYYDVWRYDYRLFRPIFAFARKHHIPVVGLNIDRDIVSAVYKTGTIDGLSDTEGESIPAERVLDLPGYRERLKQTYGLHDSMSQAPAGSFSGFIQAQALWDESMAESVVEYMNQHPSATMIVLAGSQHTRKDSGIPPRVERRLPLTQAVVANLATSPLSGNALRTTSDYLFLLDTPEFPPQGKMGIVLQAFDNDSGSGMEILDITPSSPAQRAGLMKGDILRAIDDTEIHSMADVRVALLDKTVGEGIKIMVNRTNKDGSFQNHSFTITLYNPDMGRAHP